MKRLLLKNRVAGGLRIAKIRVFFLILCPVTVLLFISLSAAQVSFAVGPPETILSSEEISTEGLHNDAPLSAVNDGGVWKWFSQGLGYYSGIGPKENPFEQVIVRHGFLMNVPDENRYIFSHPVDGVQPLEKYPFYQFNPAQYNPNIRLADYTGPAGYWLANVYRVPETGHLIGFYHVEVRHPSQRMMTPTDAYCRVAQSISKDGGNTFTYCGNIFEPNFSWDFFLTTDFPQGKTLLIGMPSVLIKDEYFYIYVRDRTPGNGTQDYTGSVVLRAKVVDVVTAAERNEVVPWYKFYQGQWNEKGLGGAFSRIEVPGTNYQRFLDGDAAYNEYLKRYMIVGQTDGAGTGRVLITFSSDGLNWEPWQIVHEDAHYHIYPTIVSMGDDNEVAGRSFWVYYRNSPRVTFPTRSPFEWDRVRIDLNPVPTSAQKPVKLSAKMHSGSLHVSIVHGAMHLGVSAPGAHAVFILDARGRNISQFQGAGAREYQIGIATSEFRRSNWGGDRVLVYRRKHVSVWRLVCSPVFH